MASFVTLLAALMASIDGKRFGSMLFGGLHFAAFFLDACSHVPGGTQIFKARAGSEVLGRRVW